MKIKITGIKRIVNDNPNKGKVLNGAHVHFTHSDSAVIGEAAEHKWLNNGQYPISDIEIGKVYNAEIFQHMFSLFQDINPEEE